MENVVEKRWEEESTCCLGTIAVVKFWCPRMVVSALWWNDAIVGGCHLSTNHDQDTERFGGETEGTWFYEITLIFG